MAIFGLQGMAEQLERFFKEHGWIAEMPANYAYYVELMFNSILEASDENRSFRERKDDFKVEERSCSNAELELCDPKHDPGYCTENALSYEYTVKRITGEEVCCIPAMTDEGYFIIDGEKKVLLIQEVRLKTEHYVMDEPPRCECNLMGSYNPVKVSIQKCSQLQIDTSMINKDIREINSVGMRELLLTLYSEEDAEALRFNVFMLFFRHSKELAEACMLFTFAHSQGGLRKGDSEVIREKIFCNQSNNTILFTLIPMIVECVKIMFRNRKPSDRDNYVFKRLRTPGEILHVMMKSCISTCRNSAGLQKSVKNTIYNCLKRGEVMVNNTVYSKMAVQFSERSRIDALSSIRKVRVPCDDNSASMSMRQIHESQIGYICPCETPEGKTVGVMKHLASTCLISVQSMGYDQQILSLIECYTNIPTENDEDIVWIQLDGMVVGWCSEESAKDAKPILKGKDPNWGVVLDVGLHKAGLLKIRTTPGRPMRPLISSSSEDFEYMDPDEFEHKSTEHKELHPCTMLGLAASLIPFPEHNQSARNVFASSMIKQSQQMIGSEKTCSMLQKPVVYTLVAKLMDYEPNGINLVTCIMSLSGYNQEDAIIVNKACVERGAFNSKVRKKVYIEVDSPWEMLGESREKNTEYFFPYLARGRSSEEEPMRVYGSFRKRKDDKTHADMPVIIMSGGIEKTIYEIKPMLQNERLVSIDEERMQSGKTKLAFTFEEHRTLQLGDKLSSRHGQKGVVGLLMSQEDMPFTLAGITPDIVINPHAIPSRMTVGQLIEGVLGKEGCISHSFKDGTPFMREGREEMKDILLKSDTEKMFMGTTGEMISTPIAMGIVYYMALSHQVEDKVYVRSYGPTSMMSRQPISGRSKGGGLRFGGMEYDCLIAHGASELITSVSLNSDSTEVPYCSNCSVVMDVQVCRYCNRNTVKKHVPFSYAVMKDLMLSAGIKVESIIR